MSIPLTPQADEAWAIIRRQLFEVERQLTRMRVKAVDKTINASDILDGFWVALPRWRQGIDNAVAGTTGSALQDHVRNMSGNPALDLVGDWVGLKAAINAMVTDIRDDADLFVQSGPDAGKEANTIEDIGGERRSVVYSAGEMDYLIPHIDACLAFLG